MAFSIRTGYATIITPWFRTFLSPHEETSCPLALTSPHAPTLSSPWRSLHSDGFAYSGHFIWMESYNMWPFASRFFHCLVFSVFICVVACISTLFLFAAEYYSIKWIWIYYILFIHSSFGRQLGCLHFWLCDNASVFKK